MTRSNSDDTGRDAERLGASRRTVLRTGAWSAPVILASTAAPAFAASAGAISGVHQVVRSGAFSIDSSGTVTNGTTTTQTVTVTWTWMCDSTGFGAGRFTSGTTDPTGWNFSSFVYVSGGGNAQRGANLVVSRVLAAGATVPLPPTTLNPSGMMVTGTVTVSLSASATATIVQPAQVTFPAFTGFTGFSGKQSASAPSARRATGRGSGLVSIGEQPPGR